MLEKEFVLDLQADDLEGALGMAGYYWARSGIPFELQERRREVSLLVGIASSEDPIDPAETRGVTREDTARTESAEDHDDRRRKARKITCYLGRNHVRPHSLWV